MTASTVASSSGQRAAKPASNTAGKLVPCKVAFNLEDAPLDWIPDQAFASQFINEIHMLLPAGEFWFCRLFSKAMPLIRDDKLRADVQDFIRQEAMHARAHESALEDYLHRHGIETEGKTRIVKWIVEVLFADAPFGKPIPKRLEKQWLVFRLGVVASIEHMTCVLGNYVLQNKSWDQAGADPVLLDMLRWHGAEEVEHRSVAFDLYKHLGGGYLSRYYLALITVPGVIGMWVYGAAYLMKQHPEFAHRKPSPFRPWIWREWSKVARSGHLPSPLTLILRKQLPFFLPWYDPVKEGSTAEALAYLQTSLAAGKPAGTVH